MTNTFNKHQIAHWRNSFFSHYHYKQNAADFYLNWTRRKIIFSSILLSICDIVSFKMNSFFYNNNKVVSRTLIGINYGWNDYVIAQFRNSSFIQKKNYSKYTHLGELFYLDFSYCRKIRLLSYLIGYFLRLHSFRTYDSFQHYSRIINLWFIGFLICIRWNWSEIDL